MRSGKMNSLRLAAAVALSTAAVAIAGSGAAFTTFNPWVDGLSKDVCRGSLTNCNIYGAKEGVWINGGPLGADIGPDGWYFFAVLAPGGEMNPNDGPDANLSYDFDSYLNRTFEVRGGAISQYVGTHWADSGNTVDATRKYCSKSDGCAPDGFPPFLRVYPYADVPNAGGVYILAVCSLADGYPVDPRECKYDAFRIG